jgi:outer membrane protein OmpA-like peptidoglycan-associated protein
MRKEIFLGILLSSCVTEKPIDPLPEKTPEPEVLEEPYSYESSSVAVVNFDFDKIILSKVEKQKIMNQVWKLRKPSTPIKIIGYTDSQGSEAYNQTLSENRAKSVAAFLIGLGIHTKWIEMEGKGETSLLNNDKTLGEHFANRRVEIIYVVK